MTKVTKSKLCSHPFPIYQGTSKITGEPQYVCSRCGYRWSKDKGKGV